MVSDRSSSARADDAVPAAARGFVSVERYELPPSRTARTPLPPDDAFAAAPALSVAVRTPSGGVLLRATAGAARPGGPRVLDEHFVVDADVHREQRWLDCADVLCGSRTRGAGDAAGWLRRIAAGRSGCRMAAVPLAKGGWAVLDTARQQVTVLPVDTPRGQWLWPSCLLGWLTAGGSLQELASVRPAYHSPAGPCR
ncbi:hypothetical protein [Actinacidiphila sp. ITFR-21]|uniref:hypothetical protein n=1 Tax=Actinacidiphila sp. ITFR-21 TaxID=3075199 RepID=UPI0028892F98|nr:hypothetical protein [Streptomyces sp. ITFR-21]WNI14732.1 hypothetical protein RLT57_03715 [Streptomyces sp. ITFR-21]